MLDTVEVVHLPPRDLAIVKTSVPQLVYPRVQITSVGDAGSAMFTFGAPNGHEWLMGAGAIRASALVPAPFAHDEFAMTCSTCDNGSSGGGIFNAQGELEGILVAGYPAPDGVYTFIAEPVTYIFDILANL